MNRHNHIFFDLDHTLWDFDRCAAETLEELYGEFGLAGWGPPFSEFLAVFHEVNSWLWAMYDFGKIDKDQIRLERFDMVFGKLGLHDHMQHAQKLGTEYLFRCPQKTYLIEHTLETLNYLDGRYKLHILTNGFNDVQRIKMESSKISCYFDVVVTSESTGHKKPSREIFEFALQTAGAGLRESVMIGDNLSTDIRGAIGAGMDCVYYNPKKQPHTEPVFLDIACLSELRSVF